LADQEARSAASVDPTEGLFHLRSGFYFGREGDEVVIAQKHPALERDGVSVVDMVGVIRVPLNEWASVVASTMPGGETTESYEAALALLTASPSGNYVG
jgi:hypothetical protein